MGKFNRAEHCRKIAHLGGKATYQKYGRRWMSLIGKVGFQRTCDKHFNGDRRAMVEDLIARGTFAGDSAARDYDYFYQFPEPEPHPAWTEVEVGNVSN